MSESTQTYIALTVGGYHLALPAAAVSGVLTDVLTNAPTPFLGERLPIIDLAVVFAHARRLVAPFAVAVEARGERILIGVDAVAHAPLRGQPVPVPKLGLLRPDLIEEAVRHDGQLTIILSPRSLIGL